MGPGAERDLPALPGLEAAAGEAFRALGMDAVADDTPPAPEELRPFLLSGGLLVARDREDGPPVAYALLEVVDGCLHIEQVSVRPDHARQRIGRALLERAAVRAVAEGLPALTLTTFAHVPWNAPYYRRCGFRPLAPHEETPGLRRLRAREAAAGLDHWPRLCMRRDLETASRQGK
ncbi:GNAT family N-acetyltransferase [Streptomyces sp. RKND-216]|uniref:GNAT family N-acetyltransferase n=1 Tax=Streptomyces sp. RKND-216 TaxID=2562581 RepID=UPI001FF82898|nr:GNAT family N-acetyltransferase [Streptomyces sp. RKND-216]